MDGAVVLERMRSLHPAAPGAFATPLWLMGTRCHHGVRIPMLSAAIAVAGNLLLVI